MGARLESWWPLSIPVHGFGVNITVQSYVDSLDFGVVAASNVLPAPDAFVGAMRDAFAELRGLRQRAARPA